MDCELVNKPPRVKRDLFCYPQRGMTVLVFTTHVNSQRQVVTSSSANGQRSREAKPSHVALRPSLSSQSERA